MEREQLKAWVAAWAEVYPAEEDEPLLVHRGKSFLGSSEVRELVAWKYPEPRSGRRLYRYTRILHLFDQNPEDVVEARTREAFLEGDDGRALATLRRLKGIGEAIGSTILTSHDPARFTVYDTKALKSLRALGYLENRDRWDEYLVACRQVSRLAMRDLRTVDRALFSANGRLELPS